MKKIKHLLLLMTLIMFSTTFYGQDISNLEKSELEDAVRQIVMTEVNNNPVFKDYRVSNTTAVKFEKRTSPQDNSHITDPNQIGYGLKKGDVVMMITFYNDNNETIIESSVLLRNSAIRFVFRGDMMGFSGDALLNSK